MIVRLAIAAIALSVAVMLISVSTVKGFQNEISGKIRGFASDIELSKNYFGQSYEQIPVTLDNALFEKIKNADGVNHVQATALKAGIMKSEDGMEGVVLKAVDTSFNSFFFEENMKSHKGKLIPINKNEIIISQSLANRLFLDTGMSVMLYFVQRPVKVRKLEVKGIYQTGLEEVDNNFCFSSLDLVQSVNDWDSSTVGALEVFTQNQDRDALKKDLNALLNYELLAHTLEDRYPQLFDWLNLLNGNVTILFILMSLVAAINMITALVIMILEKTQMVGILKSLGMANNSVRRIFILNASILIAAGVAIGNAVAFSYMILQDRLKIISLPSESYYLDTVPVFFDWPMFLFINIGTLVVCTIVMILPSLIVTRITPIKALRFN